MSASKLIDVCIACMILFIAAPAAQAYYDFNIITYAFQVVCAFLATGYLSVTQWRRRKKAPDGEITTSEKAEAAPPDGK